MSGEENDGTKAGETDPGAGGAGGGESGKTEAPKPFDVNALPEEARTYLAAQIADAQAKARLTGKANAAAAARAEVIAEFATKLGITSDKPTEAQLTEAINNAERERDTVTRERDAIRAARKLGGDDEAMIDSASFLGKLHKLDPKSDTYSADMATLIAAEIEANPRFKAAGVTPPASTGGGGEFGKRTPSSAADDGSVESMDKQLYGSR